jgi:hypothetical protein
MAGGVNGLSPRPFLPVEIDKGAEITFFTPARVASICPGKNLPYVRHDGKPGSGGGPGGQNVAANEDSPARMFATPAEGRRQLKRFRCA